MIVRYASDARRAERGFVLMDALIALAITAVVLGSFVGVVRSTLLARTHVAETRAALPLARSLLAAMVAGATSSSRGRLGLFLWQAKIEPMPPAEGALRPDGPPLEQITVEVATPGGPPLVRLSTLRLRTR